MPGLMDFAANVEWPDDDSIAKQRAAVPADGSWGQLAEHAEWLAGAQGQCPPQPLERVRLIRFGAVVASDTSDVRDVAAVDATSVDAAANIGSQIADDEIDRGADLLVVTLGELTLGATALICVVTATEPVKVVPRGLALSVDAWSHYIVTLRDIRRRAKPHRAAIADLLGTLLVEDGMPDLAAVCGLLLQCATRRTPVVIDAAGAAAAALAAYEVQPRAARWWRAADQSVHPAHALALAHMAQQPVLALGTGLSDGSAGMLAVAVLHEAVRVSGAPPG